MKSIRKLDNLLSILSDRIFQSMGIDVPLVYRQATSDDRAAMVRSDRSDWTPVGPDHIWGEPDGYYWFAGGVVLPQGVEGARIFARIEAAFGNVMGRSDPQCLVRVDGRIVQGGDANHREFPLNLNACPGQSHDILIEAGTIEDRRQIGFALSLLRHDPVVEDIYYDLRVPLDVARLLDENDPRRHFILRVLEQAVDTIDLRQGRDDRFKSSLSSAKAIVAKIYEAADFKDMPVVVATGHTHIDVAWLWRVRETRQKMARSMATMLSLMEEFPDYQFMYNQCVLLDYLSEDYPDLFKRVQSQFQAGRFEIEGALWLEPDVNIAGGEALIRHILYGVRYHQQTFGVRPRMVWLPDTFGYSAALPQLMAKSGLDSFVTHKLSWNDTNRMPEEKLFWQGIDGSKVVSYFLTTQPYDSHSIGTTYCPNLKPTHVMGTWRRYGQQRTGGELFLVYGHGDGGGGPTREMLHNIRRMERGIPGCPKVQHGAMRPFFERLIQEMQQNPEEFPVWVGEFYLEFHRGTLTSVAKNKRNNRKAEIALRELELLAVTACRANDDAYPHDRLRQLWDILMLNQFHDILPGSSIGAVYEDSDRDYQAFFTEMTALERELADRIHGSAEPTVLNAAGRERGGLVCTPLMEDQAIQYLVRADGSRENALWLGSVAPLTLAPLPLVDFETHDTGSLEVSKNRLANRHLEILFDDAGRIVHLLDRASGRTVLESGMTGNRLQAFRDHPAEYDAWDIDADFEDQSFEIDDLMRAEVVETGPLRAAIRFEWRYETSRIVQIVALENNARRVDFDTFVDWHEHNTLVKAAFPLALHAVAVDAEIQFGHVRRATHRNTSWDRARFECVMQRFVDVTEPDFGVALLNDCKYGYDAKAACIRLTLLRSPTYPWPEADQGEHRFRYALMIHGGDKDEVHRAAEDFNMPLRIIEGSKAGRPAPVLCEPPLLCCNTRGIAVETVKRAEDGPGVIVRLWETTGKHRIAELTLAPEFKVVTRVDLLEDAIEPMTIADRGVQLPFKPFEIVSLKLERSTR